MGGGPFRRALLSLIGRPADKGRMMTASSYPGSCRRLIARFFNGLMTTEAAVGGGAGGGGRGKEGGGGVGGGGGGGGEHKGGLCPAGVGGRHGKDKGDHEDFYSGKLQISWRS